ncbi:MAG TPA: sorbosone dehydrogenase family protein [Candidatus Acidoferrales bacterium]|jgi:glucose/arabinose dehydrogenase|nr:sorbosone dehydrogenase family protein [Candidatus Acidoferrales bacterium]
MRRFYQGLAIATAFGLALLLSIVAGSGRAVHAQFAPPPAHPVDPNAKAGTPGVFQDYTSETPGHMHHITAKDLPDPYATKSSAVFSRPVPRGDMWPKAPEGFKVELWAENLKGDDGKPVSPRTIITAPNGDLFAAAQNQGEILVFRAGPDGKFAQMSVYATKLNLPFGLRFYPAGPNPKYLYVGDTNAVLRFPYSNGDLKATADPETVVANLPAGPNHFSRGLAFSLDGKRMFISVGSHSNVPPASDPDPDPLEFHRADILVADPDGSNLKVYATGIRNGSGLVVNPTTGELWTSVNERDEIGDNLPPDYITHVQEGGFYGWPWYYTGDHQDPRFPGKHPELKDTVLVPDVLLEPHDASLNITFYEGKMFPKQYKGQLFAAEHGSWNRSVRTGYEVIMAPMKDGHAVGDYEDFLTGFVNDKGECWGRPVGVTVASDGALMVTDDGSNSIWRVSYEKK